MIDQSPDFRYLRVGKGAITMIPSKNPSASENRNNLFF